MNRHDRRLYCGRRVFDRDSMKRGEPSVVVQGVVDDRASGRRPLAHISYHSPDGFEWGYAGSGPADLALAILADHFGEPAGFVLAALRSLWTPRSKAAALHQLFKERFLATEYRDEWQLDSGVIEAWLETPSIRARLAELAQEDDELAEIRRLEQEAESASAEAAD
jgi:hypothetical protein